uniref:sulfurtransferase complex subunit TusC n=1 Tax=uncultured Halomonas sp. TaxID=173971 RepID=UPI0026140525|nr:sulfurtransferase complex subunit TusC [uncultured Halomonas sp.]
MTEDTPSAELLVILRHAPHGSSWLKEGLDVALVAAAFDRRVTLLFMGEGVTALLEGQQAGPLGQKGTAATLEMLEMYDVDSLVVEKRSLDALGLSGDQLMLPTREVTEAGIAALVASHALVLNF